MIEVLLQNDKNRTLIELISIRKDNTTQRPKYQQIGKKSASTGIAALFGTNKSIKVGDLLQDDRKDDELVGLPELCFDTIIHIALKIDTKTEQLITLITMMKKECEAQNLPDGLN
jgi:hypothetical protein